jgi:hypothetical protein
VSDLALNVQTRLFQGTTNDASQESITTLIARVWAECNDWLMGVPINDICDVRGELHGIPGAYGTSITMHYAVIVHYFFRS